MGGRDKDFIGEKMKKGELDFALRKALENFDELDDYLNSKKDLDDNPLDVPEDIYGGDPDL